MSSDTFDSGLECELDLAKLPALQRAREPRQPLLDPGKYRLIIILVVGVALVAALTATYVITSRVATVPNLIGLSENAARTSARRRRLDVEVSQRLYSTRPKGTVLSQNLRSGARVRTGRVIAISISGGTAQVMIPDVSGLSRKEAITRLESLGLLVNEISQNSQARAGTVISTSPGAGTRIQIGETVVVHVARATESITLADYDLSGQVVVIEPTFCASVTSVDITYDISQRLSALVQAAGGKAVITRASTEATVAPDTLNTRARLAHPTASVTISVDGVNSSALAVSALQQGGSLGQTLFEELKWVSSTTIFSNTAVVSAADPARSALVSLGRSTSAADRALFTDDLFRDNVARALYMALGKTCGR